MQIKFDSEEELVNYLENNLEIVNVDNGAKYDFDGLFVHNGKPTLFVVEK